jgi:hypothetical protein
MVGGLPCLIPAKADPVSEICSKSCFSRDPDMCENTASDDA